MQLDVECVNRVVGLAHELEEEIVLLESHLRHASFESIEVANARLKRLIGLSVLARVGSTGKWSGVQIGARVARTIRGNPTILPESSQGSCLSISWQHRSCVLLVLETILAINRVCSR
jgi:hypothetical protein